MNISYLHFNKGQHVKEGEDGEVDVERSPPVLEDGHRDVLYLPGRHQSSQVHRGEPGGPDDATHHVSSLGVVSGKVDLLTTLQSSIL